jgi:phage repressor protein C with HTH and peptisase S24 domain
MNKKGTSTGPLQGLKETLSELPVRNVFISFRRDWLGAAEGSEKPVLSTAFSAGFAGRLRFLKETSRLQNNQLSAAFGVSESGFKKWLAGSAEPSLKNLVSIQDVTGVSLEWLVNGAGRMFRDVNGENAVPGYVYVPRYDVRVSAGTGQIVESEDVKGLLAFREDWVRSKLRRNPKYLAVLEAFGDSMTPTISDGDIMLVDTSEMTVRGPAIYVVLAGNQAIVKRVELKMDGSLVVKSDNPAYEPYTYKADQTEELRVLGKVVWAGGML